MKRGPKPKVGVLRNQYGQIVCEHGRQKRQCTECGGTSICEHDKRRCVCRECKILGVGGSSLCGTHHRRKNRCRLCGTGVDICEHGKERQNCRDCGGSQTCSHKAERRDCVVCSPESAFKRMSARAKKERELDFDLSYENFLNFVNSDCFYCGVKAPNGIDRIDNTIGYIQSNCRSCCKICNIMKLNHTERTFFEHIRKIFYKQDLEIGE